jgi:hypothetical protein
MIDKDPPHGLGRHTHEMGPILPNDPRLINKVEIGLVNQGSWLQGVIPSFPAQVNGS